MKNKILLIAICLILLLVNGCKKNTPIEEECQCTEGVWVFPEGTKCLEEVYAECRCIKCNQVMEYAPKVKYHEKIVEEKEPTCGEDGYLKETCANCDYSYQINFPKTDEHNMEYRIIRKATDKQYGLKQAVCTSCDKSTGSVPFIANGVSDHGKLSVNGRDLVDENDEKFQLLGISTHGLQWFGHYVNFDTFDALHNTFGINVIRLSLTTAEGGYCESNDEKKEYFYQLVAEGIKIATKLDMYVIVDWHMVGAEDDKDKNPLTYKDEAVQFFSRLSAEFKDYNNILYEIMNEPNGPTTWNDCKTYANLVIPEIRKNTDAIILVGSNQWSSNLNAVMQSPLEGYDNIMYTYHFYAATHYSTSVLANAYDKGLPVFVSEHGGMDSSGDGDINYTNIESWYHVLDSRNISYVAWNLSNSKGTSSILKQFTTSLTDFSDNALKEWGIYYKNHVRERFNFPDLYDKNNQ